jgi:hypothetical protein
VPVIDVIATGCAVASFGTFFSMPWRLLACPVAAGMVAHAGRWALISVAGGSALTGALVACMLVGIVATPVVNRPHLPFAAVAFSAVVSLMPGCFPVQRRDGPRRIGLDRVGRAGSADEHRCERRHGISDHHDHDLRADSPAPTVRELAAHSNI